MDDAQLRTVWQQRQFGPPAVPLAHPLALVMKPLRKIVRQLGPLAAIWEEVIPPGILEHTALDGLCSGVLTVLVDSSPHRFQLRQLLDGGLLAEIRSRFRGALNKVRLEPGQFAEPAGRRPLH
jgi:hypothetical protein